MAKMARAADIDDRDRAYERRVRQRRRGIVRRHTDIPWAAAPRVLLIASSLEARLLYAALLEEGGYSVYAVSDAIEALQTITARMPDAVVLGDGCSGPDSLALLNALRGDLATSDVPAVVLAAAQVQSGASTRDPHTGPTMLLGEPVPADAVLAAVDDLTRATPPDRFGRRQLRRTLLTLRTVAHRTGDPGRERLDLCATIDRLHAIVLGLDDRGGIVAASRGAETLTGFTRRELTSISVFDSLLGAHLPLAGIWETHATSPRANGTVTIREKNGRSLLLGYGFEVLMPDVHALALVHAPV
jgi:two-component system chemotaxis response regulator CheY